MQYEKNSSSTLGVSAFSLSPSQLKIKKGSLGKVRQDAVEKINEPYTFKASPKKFRKTQLQHFSSSEKKPGSDYLGCTPKKLDESLLRQSIPIEQVEQLNAELRASHPINFYGSSPFEEYEGRFAGSASQMPHQQHSSLSPTRFDKMVPGGASATATKMYDDLCATPAMKYDPSASYNRQASNASSGGKTTGILDTGKTAKTAVTSENSEDLGPAATRLKSKMMSEIKPIKIADLISRVKDSDDVFKKPIEVLDSDYDPFDPSNLGTVIIPQKVGIPELKSASKADVEMIEKVPVQKKPSPQKKLSPQKIQISPFKLPGQFEGDRFLPMRAQEPEEMPETFDVKMEIESCPPEALLQENAGMESPQQQQNNQIGNQAQNSASSSQDLSSGENLRKYNILLQSTMLDIKNPHTVANSFLNENTNFLNQQAQVIPPSARLPHNGELELIGSGSPTKSSLFFDTGVPASSFLDEQDDALDSNYNVLRYSPTKENQVVRPYEHVSQNSSAPPAPQPFFQNADDPMRSPFSVSHNLFSGIASEEEEGPLTIPYRHQRKIQKSPFKVLDAPALQDDYYLNLVDWSSLNVLAVGLGSCVYLWSATTSKVTKLYDLGHQDQVTSISWSANGDYLAVGTSSGELQSWDIAKQKMVRKFSGHDGRIGCIAWASSFLSSGSRDKSILHRDMRAKSDFFSKLEGHKQEVCGLKWSPDQQQLASGGNDNKLLIWDKTNHLKPLVKFSEHVAAVKAIAWSPHQHGTMCSGGGTADRCIRFWNTLTCKPMHWVDTGSQVCNLVYSKNVNELVSTHGYSKNEIIVWKQPQMKKMAVLTGHTYRVLYLAMSPDGQTLVTGAGDETLRFWKVFPSKKQPVQQKSKIVGPAFEIR